MIPTVVSCHRCGQPTEIGCLVKHPILCEDCKKNVKEGKDLSWLRLLPHVWADGSSYIRQARPAAVSDHFIQPVHEVR